MAKHCLVIGFGSIGQRHVKVLNSLGCDVDIVSRHLSITEKHMVFRSVTEACAINSYDYFVIANETNAHADTLKEILPFLSGNVVCCVEKPLFAFSEQTVDCGDKKVAVGYVLRAHPLLRQVKSILQDKKLYSCRACCGQYLPTWRPQTNYTKCYSANRVAGGGVLRDLSHETDYMQMLTGTWKKVAAIGGNFSDLQISADDQYGLLFAAEKCPLCICQIDYLARNVHRDLFVEYEGGSLHLDFIKGILQHNGVETSAKLERDTLFRTMHSELMAYDLTYFSDAANGCETVKFLEAAERASERDLWIKNQ